MDRNRNVNSLQIALYVLLVAMARKTNVMLIPIMFYGCQELGKPWILTNGIDGGNQMFELHG